MKTESYYLFLQKYLSEHPQDFVASHETGNINVPSKIIDTGLRVSHSPYGKKIRRYMTESGRINLENCFMATMSVLKKESLERDKFFFENPIAPTIISIPHKLLEIADINQHDDETHKFFCGYGFEDRPDENGRCGLVTPLPDSESHKANIRLLPNFLIAGHFNPETNEFIENNKHFSKLPKEEQEKIMEAYKLKYELQCQNQPQ